MYFKMCIRDRDWDWEQADAFEGAGSETIRIEDLEQAGGAGREHCLEVLLRISCLLYTSLIELEHQADQSDV